MSPGLTERQAQCLAAIKHLTAEKGFAPTYRELAAYLGSPHVSGVYRLVMCLQERRLVTVGGDHGRARSLSVVEGPTIDEMMAWSPELLIRVAKDVESVIYARAVKRATNRADQLLAEPV